MVSYSSGAAALLAITGLAATTVNAKHPTKKQHLRKDQQRKLYDHMETETDTDCKKEITGNPKVCVIVCTATTSILAGEKLVDEHTETTQRKCEAGWEDDGHSWSGDTEWPTYSPTPKWSGDWPTYSPTSSPKKPTHHPTKKPVWNGDGHEDTDSPTKHPTKAWTGDGHERVVDWTDDGWDSYSSPSNKDAWGPSHICTDKSAKVSSDK